MPVVKKIETIIGFGEPIIDNSQKSDENALYFLEKAAKAKERISKVKFPEHLKK